MVALPGQLFYSTQIPVCLWFLTKDKSGRASLPRRPDQNGPRSNAALPRDRRKQTLFIDARKMGTLIDRVHRELTDADIEKIVSTYHAWRKDGLTPSRQDAKKGKDSELSASASLREYSDIPGFCKSATTAEITTHGYVLTPGRYVGAEEVEDDGEPFEEKMPRLVAELNGQFCESAKLEKAIKANLRELGYGS
jgi:type I restriction enzyme M protein